MDEWIIIMTTDDVITELHTQYDNCETGIVSYMTTGLDKLYLFSFDKGTYRQSVKIEVPHSGPAFFDHMRIHYGEKTQAVYERQTVLSNKQHSKIADMLTWLYQNNFLLLL